MPVQHAKKAWFRYPRKRRFQPRTFPGKCGSCTRGASHFPGKVRVWVAGVGDVLRQRDMMRSTGTNWATSLAAVTTRAPSSRIRFAGIRTVGTWMTSAAWA